MRGLIEFQALEIKKEIKNYKKFCVKVSVLSNPNRVFAIVLDTICFSKTYPI